MKVNEGTLDRIVRLAIAVVLLPVLAIGPLPGWGLISLVGVLALITGVTGYCLTYTLLGIDTAGSDRGAAPSREVAR
jgi:hypothetical protein